VELLVLTARPQVEANRRLEDAAARRGERLRVVDATRTCATAGASAHLWLDDVDLLHPAPDAVLARVGNWRPESVLAALETAVAAGVRTPNPAAAMRVGRDHWRTVRCLAAAGLRVPESIAGADPEALSRVAVDRLGLPVVVKQRRSRMGVGVIRCSTRDHLEAVLDSLWRVGDEVMVQRFVESGGTSLRVVVVGGRAVASAHFTAAAGEWRSNAARGGRALPHAPGPGEESLAVAAAAALGLGVCGVDLLPAPDGWVVVEVNPSPGLRHVEAASGVDVAAAVVGELQRCAGRT